MENELSKTFDGQDRLERTKDRLETKVAEIGQAELDKEHGEPKTHQNQEDIVESDVNEAEVAAPMDQGSPIPSTPRDAPDPERFDTSSRLSSPKRRIGEDNMEDESQDKTTRPMSPTISCRTDAESADSHMDDVLIDLLNGIGNKIRSASILGVDIS